MEKIKEVMFSSKSDEWETPEATFRKLDQEFGFDLDPCASDNNHKCEEYYTKEQDGLKQSWEGRRVWCNPPYGRQIAKWVEKAHQESQRGALVVMLIPARTDTKWFHEWIYGKAEIRFIRGRIKFGGQKNNAPFPSMVVIFGKRADGKQGETP